jgi:hypothetical protein
MLLERLVARAREEGVRRFTSVLLTRNLAIAAAVGRTGTVRVTSRFGASLELEVELPFDTGARREALRAAAAGEVTG